MFRSWRRRGSYELEVLPLDQNQNQPTSEKFTCASVLDPGQDRLASEPDTWNSLLDLSHMTCGKSLTWITHTQLQSSGRVCVCVCVCVCSIICSVY